MGTSDVGASANDTHTLMKYYVEFAQQEAKLDFHRSDYYLSTGIFYCYFKVIHYGSKDRI
ncbi:MAG: hypothetical protein BBJ57_10000 [Desulfobacterales bacterium PC51MH44]|nr:MAG: hypothetical protein BBJ57_10000 [Desulfobacterales bacterium PC51MH44]